MLELSWASLQGNVVKSSPGPDLSQGFIGQCRMRLGPYGAKIALADKQNLVRELQ